MARGAVAVSVEGDSGRTVRLIGTHLKSKLLTFPGGRFNPRDEDERARYAAYACTAAPPRPRRYAWPSPRTWPGTASSDH
jgi:hypothetical protein